METRSIAFKCIVDAFTRLFASYMRGKTFCPITRVPALCQKSVLLATYVSPRPARNSLNQCAHPHL